MTDTAPEPAAVSDTGGAPMEARQRAPEPAKGRPGAAQRPRPAQQVLERLFELYPKMFGARFLPLKLGVFQELMALHADEFKKEDLKVALGLHARSTRYLESVASGAKRHNPNGMPVEDVAPEHVHHAIMEVFRRRQARSKEDLRPWLRTRLIQSIEASGLSREEYTQRVPTQDPVALEALDEAFAAIAEQAAKREALRRAFEASGRSIEAFAEMYGIELSVVRRALAPARARE
jgi:ProP effector